MAVFDVVLICFDSVFLCLSVSIALAATGTDLANSNLKVALLGSANVFGMALQEMPRM
jgi:hypothetical protein